MASSDNGSLAPLIPRLAQARVLVIGDLVLDQFIYGLTDRISREAPVPIVRETRRDQRPGGAANVVANLRALGARTKVLGVVGKDDAGRNLRDLLSHVGVATTGLVVSSTRPTEAKTRILAGGLSTTPQQVVRLDQGSHEPLDEKTAAKLVTALEKALPSVDLVAVSDYGLGTFVPAVVRAVRKAARTKPVVVDSRFDLKRFGKVTVIKPNAPELEAATGRRADDARSAARAARYLAAELELEAVLLTRGHEGLCLAGSRGKATHLPPHGPPEAVDVTGAGDTVLACFCAALASGASFEDAARLANIAGGIVVQKPGTEVASLAELEAAVRTGGGR
ncbi:MAG: PfkB family carbohydrate kinase [Deltaproteobacteria bacterium]|nr:PfkB family carbohydrate kinase [Deltaproteobacteria bacterium]